MVTVKLVMAVLLWPQVTAWRAYIFERPYFGGNRTPVESADEQECIEVVGQGGSMTALDCVRVYPNSCCQGPYTQFVIGSNRLNSERFALSQQVLSISGCEFAAPVHETHQGWHVTLFEHDTHGGSCLYLESDHVADCQNINDTLDNQISSVVTYDICVRLYKDRDCTGQFVEMGPGRPCHRDLRDCGYNDKVSSVMGCVRTQTETETWQANLFAHSFHDTLVATVSGNTAGECKNTEEAHDNTVSSVDTSGSCVRLYEDNDCQGQFLEIAPGSTCAVNLIPCNFNDKISSVGGCKTADRTADKTADGSAYELQGALATATIAPPIQIIQTTTENGCCLLNRIVLLVMLGLIVAILVFLKRSATTSYVNMPL